MSASAATAYEVLRAADRRDGGLPMKVREKLLTRLERATIDARDAIAAAIDGASVAVAGRRLSSLRCS